MKHPRATMSAVLNNRHWSNHAVEALAVLIDRFGLSDLEAKSSYT